jgi:DNA-binding response OmpR family regulator
LQCERAALLRSDVMMPKLDGFALLRRVRAEPALKSVSIALLSARAGEEARVEGIDAGADDHLVKPFSARALLARVGALLERRVYRRSCCRESSICLCRATARSIALTGISGSG